ncbi:uncharacterized protein LOC134706199 isoform X2 [Mytilus trossulus]|uniref:uncharacterized protein LOC134706199 isoform X2 n=1 Tax=Mytilus trossulus TaxID=6551 RepID=UPI0030072B7D
MLHCIYLGEVSILLKCMLSRCTDLQKENLQLALNAANWKGFHHKCGEKFIKYHKSSQGKDFRSFVQHAPFTVHHAGFSTEIVKLWCLLSEIVQLSNKLAMQESELSRLGDLQYQFNQLIYQQFPDTLKKQKIHHCLHTEEQIRLHGVPIGYTTETGESWCGIVKHLQSITNHHNANRDTAMKLAHIEEICHIIDNGTWKSNGIRVQPGKQTVDEINHPRVQSFVMGNKIQKENEQSIGVKRLELGNRTVDNRIKLNSGDIVYFRLNEHISYGLIHQITSSNVTVVMMKELGEDAVFKCLKLGLTTTRQTLLHTLIEGTLFVAHDCKNGGCCVMVTENSTRKFRHNMEHQIYFVNRFKIHFNFKGLLTF